MYVPNEDVNQLIAKTNQTMERQKVIYEQILSVPSVLKVIQLINS